MENPQERNSLIEKADLVISLLPPSLHILIARAVLPNRKTCLQLLMWTKISGNFKRKSTAKRLLFLCEMGLDPGIDHMSAMQLIQPDSDGGGKITSFRSHTGGLVAPESDDNPWHYKISWNPANVVRAGSAGAVLKNMGKIRQH